MTDSVKQLRERGDSEKITINLGYVDLGRIDLLVPGRVLFQRHARARARYDRLADGARRLAGKSRGQGRARGTGQIGCDRPQLRKAR
jgi:hypothetical protein